MIDDLTKFISLILILLLFGLALILVNANFVLASSPACIPSLQYANLIKAPDNPAVYAVLGNQKYKIPNEKIFLSYGFKWEDIKTASSKGIDSYSNIKLIKTENDPTVYYINSKKNLKKAHATAAVFLDYGNKWEDIVIINEATLNFYNNISLVKAVGEPTVYVLDKNKRNPILSAKEFESKGYKWDEIVEISKMDLESYSLLATNELQSANMLPIQQEESLGSPLSETRPKLDIAISGSSKDLFIAAGSIGKFLELRLTSLQGVSAINGITVSTFGVILNDDIGSVYLNDKENEYFSYKTNLSDKKARFIFEEPLILTEGEIKILAVKAAINAKSDIAYKTVGFSINKSEDIMTDSLIYGSFPMLGFQKEIRAGENVIGSVEISPVKLNFSQINPGAKNQKVAEFVLREKSGNEDILIEKTAFYIRGEIKPSDLINIDLVDENRKILSTATWIESDGRVEFDCGDNPLRIRKNSSKSIFLQADILGKGDKKFEFIIKDASDIKITGVSTQAELISSIEKSESGYNSLSIKKGAIFAYLNQNEAEDLIAGAKDAVLATFDFKGMNADIALKNFNLTLNSIGAPLTGDLKIINSKTKESLYAINAERLAKERTQEINLSPAQKINMGGILRLEIRADIPEEIKPDTSYSITLDKFGFDDLQNELFIIKFQQISSNPLTVKKSALYITPEEIEGSHTAGSVNVLIGQFTFQANQSEDIYLKYISVKSQEGYDEASAASGFYNFRINLGRTTDNEPLKIPIGFILKSPYRISAGSSVTVKIYADTYPTVSGNNIALTISGIDAYGKNSGAKPKIEGLNKNSNPVAFSKISAELNKNPDFAGTEVLCGKNIKIGSFIVQGSGEDMQVKEITVETSGESDIISYQNGYSRLQLKNGNRTLGTISKPLPEFNIFKTNFKMEKGETTVIDVYVDIPECCDCDDKYLQIIMSGIKSYGVSSKVIPESPRSAISNKVKVICDCGETD